MQASLLQHSRASAGPSAAIRQRQHAVQVHASGGFGKAKPASKAGDAALSGQTRKKRVNLAEEFARNRQEEAALASPSTSAPVPPEQDLRKGTWADLADAAAMDDFAAKKRGKVVELRGNKKQLVLHKYKDQIYAMDAFSTAYQYPLIDGKIADGPDGPTIETPLDGTMYDLKTGKVIKWCPRDGNPIRGFLGELKKAVQPVPLPVYPVVVKPDGKVAVRISEL